MKCPVCRAIYRPASQSQEIGTPASLLCRRCGADLTRLIQIHDRAIQHYRQAITALQATDYTTAQTQVQQALHLNHNNPDFYALAGQLWALQGEFQQAIVAWKQAQQLDPTHAVANSCLQMTRELSQ